MTLVVGLGRPDRGDDGVGPVVATAVARLVGPDLPVAIPTDPLDLLDLWPGLDVVAVDAVVADGLPPGSLVQVPAAALGTSDGPAAPVSSHGVGLVEAWALAASLGCAPRTLTLVGVVAADLSPGAGLSSPVAAAVERAVTVVLGLAGWPGAADQGRPVRPWPLSAQGSTTETANPS